MRIALAQTRSQGGNIKKNTEEHLVLVKQAAQENADAIFFPELSLSGYEPAIAHRCCLQPDSAEIIALSQLAVRHGITVAVGAPYKTEDGVMIAMFLLFPGGSVDIYCKQDLHSDELPFFRPGKKDLEFEVRGATIHPAICYEAMVPERISRAANTGASVFLASVAKPDRSIPQTLDYFQAAGYQHQIPILMVNAVGPADNFVCGGMSSVWDNRGSLVGRLDSSTPGLLIADL